MPILRLTTLLMAVLLSTCLLAQFEKQPTLWLDASKNNSIITNGNTIQSWNDQSGNNNHAVQATSSRQPNLTTIEGHNAIEFTGLQYLDIPHAASLNSSTTEGYQLFVVAKIYSDHTSPDFRTSIISKVHGGSGGQWGIRATFKDGKHIAGLPINSSNTILKGLNDNGSFTFYDYADELTQFGAYYDPATGIAKADAKSGEHYSNNYATSMTNNTVNVRIGNRNAPYPQSDVHLAVCEILYFPSKLTEQGKTQVEDYLNNKWFSEPPAPPSDNPFAPYTVSESPNLWLDASNSSSLAISGGTIQGWNDVSGNDNHATQAVESQQPKMTTVNGLPAVEFTGLQYLDIPHHATLDASTTEGLQLFAVAKIYSDHNNSDFRTCIISKNYGTQGGVWGINAVYSGGMHIAGVPYNSSNAKIKEYNGSSSVGFYDFGDELSQFSTYYDVPSGIVKADANGGAHYSNNYAAPLNNNSSVNVRIGNRNHPYPQSNIHLAVSEILYFQKKLSPQDKEQVEQYLANKWLGASGPVPVPDPEPEPELDVDFYSFDPFQLEEMPTLWLDASNANSLSTSNGQVTQWRDISGNGFVASQSDAGKQAKMKIDNNFPMVEFQGQKAMAIPHHNNLVINAQEGYQLFVVAKIFGDHSSADFRTGIIHKGYNNQGGNWGVRATKSGNSLISGLLYNSSHATLKGEFESGEIGTYDFADERTIFGAWYNPATGKSDADGGTGKQYMNEYATALNDTGTEVTLGNRHSSLNNVHLGIHEVLFFPRKLSGEEKNKVEGYLARKWNLDISGSGHVYEDSNPYTANIALGAAVSQSSDYNGNTKAVKAVDGEKDGVLSNGTVSVTQVEAEPWWEVDLGEVAEVTRINIWNRSDGSETTLRNYYVFASDVPFTSKNLNTTLNQSGVFKRLESQQAGRPTMISINRTARYIRIQMVGNTQLALAEVEVIGELDDVDRDGLSNEDEILLGTNPEDKDTDGDGISDGTEVGSNLNNPVDSDNDGYIDALDSATADSDQDGVKDQVDYENFNPCVPNNAVGLCDKDNDGLTNAEELAGNSDPNNPCDPNPNSYGCAPAAQPGGFYFAWDSFASGTFGEKAISFDNSELRPIPMAPPVGVHPRIYFRPSDIPDIKNRMVNTLSGQAVMKQMHAFTTLMHKGYNSNGYNHNTTYGRDKDGNRYIDNAGFWDVSSYYANLVNRVPNPLANVDLKRRGMLAGLMAVEAYECMVNEGKYDPDTGMNYDDRAKMLAGAMAYWAQTEINNPNLNLANRDLLGDSHYAMAYDINYNNMTPAQRDIARAGIARMVSSQVIYGSDVVNYVNTSNWSTLNSFELILNLAIEGEEGYRPDITKEFCRVYRNFITYGWYESGAPFEGLGKNYQFVATMIPMAMRGYSLLGHPAVKNYGKDFLPAISQPYGFGFVGTDSWGGTGYDETQGGYKFNQMDAIGMKWILPNDDGVDLVWRNYMEKSTAVSSTGYVYQEFAPRGYYNSLVVAGIYALDYQAGNFESQMNNVYTDDKLSYFAPQRGLVTMRSSGDSDAMMSHFHCRQDLGGHTNGDRNSFTLSSHDRMFIRYSYGNEIPETGAHSCILVNDQGLFADVVNDIAEVPGKITDFQENNSDVQVSGDATYAYSWEWKYDPHVPGVTTPELLGANGWTAVTQKPNDFQYQQQPESYYNVDFFNRPYWAGGENRISGYVKKPHNPMEKVYRTVAMARGEHPFLLVVDDVKKDNNAQNYKWLAQIAFDLSIESTPVNLDYNNYRCDIILKEASGNRRLLVRVLQNNGYTSGAPGYIDNFTNFHNNVLKRLVLEANTVSPDFKVLLYPYEVGEPLPTTSFNSSRNEWTVNIGNQSHLLDLDEQNGKTLVDIIPLNNNFRVVEEADEEQPVIEESNPTTKLLDAYALSLYPVPTYDELNFSFNAPADLSAKVQIMDLQGRVLYNTRVDFEEGTNNFTLDVKQHLAAATYLLVIDLGSQKRIAKRFVKAN